MTEYFSHASVLRQTLEHLLSGEVRAFLKPSGFAKSGRTFRRARYPLYDLINFQGSKWNGITTEHSFFVNVGVGSTEMDTVYLGFRNNRKPNCEYVLDRRWEQLISRLPSLISFEATTDLDRFAKKLIDGLDRVLAVMDGIDSTQALARWAIGRNGLQHMEKTCSYLVAIEDIEALTSYVTALRERFGDDNRWSFFNRSLIDVSGRWAPTLIEQNLLDPDDQTC